MSIPADTGGPSQRSAVGALDEADAVARRIRSRRWWYIAGALVMAATMVAFHIALASWPDRLAEVIVPGVLAIAAILAVLVWCGRTVPTDAVASANRTLYVSAGLTVVTLLLNRLLLSEGFSAWVVLTAVLPGLPFAYFAWRVSRT